MNPCQRFSFLATWQDECAVSCMRLYMVPREPTDSSHLQFSPVGFHFHVVNLVVGILPTVFYMGHLDNNKSLVMWSFDYLYETETL